MKVLIVDEDQDLIEIMTYSFRRVGHQVVGATDDLTALNRLRSDRPDMVLLDLKLSRADGFDVCRRIRQDSEVPIIIISASREEHDILRALELGADDYVTKPFSLKELAARMETVLRRCRVNAGDQATRSVRASDLELSLQSYAVTRGDGPPIQMTPLEFRILYMLAMNEGQVIPYSRLVDYAWGFEGGDASLLKSHICHIRAKLGLPLDGPGAIRSLPTVGYSLVKRRGDAAATIPAAPVETHPTWEERRDGELYREERSRRIAV